MDTLYDIESKKQFEELLATEPRESGYSPSQLFSVMVVMRCSRERAKKLIDEYGNGVDWSEASWTELRDYFAMCAY